MQHVVPELKDLYSWLEQQFHPLQLCHKVQPIFDYLATQEALAHYIKPLQDTVMMRLFQQVGSHCALVIVCTLLLPMLYRQSKCVCAWGKGGL